MDTLYTFWDNITHYKTESVHLLGLMNSATKIKGHGFAPAAPAFGLGIPGLGLPRGSIVVPFWEYLIGLYI